MWQWDGEAIGNTPPNANPNGLGNVTFNLRFPGQYADVETGLNYNSYRDYDPSTGRYVESDPLGYGGRQLSTYAYAGGNSLIFLDIFGLKLCPITLLGIGSTYLDDGFSPLVAAWLQLNENAGISVNVTEAFRSTDYQAGLANNPNATTPASAGTSLHEAGFAIDISWKGLTPSQQLGVLMNAEAVGLSWGGEFRKKADPVHFYEDPGNRDALIKAAQKAYSNGGDCDCKK